MDFSTGYVIFRQMQHTSTRIKEHLGVFPCGPFYKTFSDPKAMANRLEAKGPLILEDWMRYNEGENKIGSRQPAGRTFTFMEQSWPGRKFGSMEYSEVTG